MNSTPSLDLWASAKVRGLIWQASQAANMTWLAIEYMEHEEEDGPCEE